MTNPTSAQINAEIYNVGPALFEAVRDAVKLHGTEAKSQAEHAANKLKLEEAVLKEVDHCGMWQAIWPRVVYAGTLSAKATQEIASMRSLVPLFTDLNNYVPGRYVFDKKEWKAFADHWKSKQHTALRKQKWIALSKDDATWKTDKRFAPLNTTPEVWKILTKDYKGLRFSAKVDKIEKYLSVAEFLHNDRISGKPPSEYYTAGSKFSPLHLTGNDWLDERKTLATVQERFERQVGKLTALHIMMDLGLKTIKPDRVMTYLFSQLGWLQTLPSTLDKETVLGVYLNEDVVHEMTVRADVLAASLACAGFTQTHRLLDIWLVKYGQEPEPEFGITVNLQRQSQDGGIRAVLDALEPAPLTKTPEDAAEIWPMGEFTQVLVAHSLKKLRQAPPRLSKRLPREEAERLFVQQWRNGREVQPDIYPSGHSGIDNAPKEEILRKIVRGVDPEEAFLSVLITEDDD